MKTTTRSDGPAARQGRGRWMRVAWLGPGLLTLAGAARVAAPHVPEAHSRAPVVAVAEPRPRDDARPIGAGMPGDWAASAQRSIAASEYHAARNPRGLQAPNRAQNLRAYFAPDGVRLHDRTAAGEPLLAALRLSAVGRAEHETEVPAGQVSSADARVEIARPGLVEWYVNTPEGLEQGFTLAERPSGDGPLSLRLTVASGTVRTAGTDAALLTAAGGRELRYAGLRVEDARGERLSASLRVLSAHELRIEVADAGARYPVTVDPLISGVADARLESNQAVALMGYSVASAGDVNADGYADVIVGAPGYDSGEADEGAAFVFLGRPGGILSSGPASAGARLESNQVSALMGVSVASAGDVNGDGYADVIVGAYNYTSGELSEGAAFVFLGGPAGVASGSPATAAARLESNQATSQCGYSVASAGDVNGDGYADVIVGARLYDSGETNEGAAFVFLGGPAGILSGNPATAAARLESNQTGAFMGASVASAGDVNADGYADVIVGAAVYDSGESDEGAAFLFLGGPGGIVSGNPATASARFEPNATGAQMGTSVSSAGDVNGDGYADVIVGAPFYSSGEAGEGAALVFLGGPAGIVGGNPASASARLEANQIGANMGTSVSAAGDVNGDGYADVIVGAASYDSGETDEGAAFVFLGGPAGIVSAGPAGALARLEANQASAAMGTSVASAGDVNGDGYADVIAGAWMFSAGETNEGAAYVFLGAASGIASGNPATANARIESDQAEVFMGVRAASAGDVNGDGYADVIVGALSYDAGEANEGAAFIFLGGPAGIASGNPATASARIESDQVEAHMGMSVASAGDVNGDGYSDVIVGASEYNVRGAAFVFLGSPTGIASGNPATASARIECTQPAGLGTSVASAGDVNGDGYADVIVGAPYLGSPSGAGAAFLFLGGPAGITGGDISTANARFESNQVDAYMGMNVASAGDVNGDGYADVIVGAPYYDSGESDEGAAFVFLGGPAGIPNGNPATANARIESNQASAHLSPVAAGGDVNGDGYGDVVVAAPEYDSGEVDEGEALVFLGGPAGIASGNPATANARIESNQPGAEMGTSVASAGDVNGDGYADVIVGAWSYDAGEADEGAAFVFLGGPAGIASGNPATANARIESNQPDGEMGTSVASAGDVNGDGYADVVVGAPGYSSGEVQEGGAFVFYGNGRAGRPVLTRQLRTTEDATPVQLAGLSRSGDSVRVRVTATRADGRGLVASETQACPVGTAWGAAACVTRRSVWVAAPSGIANLEQLVSGLSADRLYRWRTRVLYGPSAQNVGAALPPRPAHGPWRRLDAQSREADIRTSAVANLSATISDSPDPVVAGRTLTYLLDVGNGGPSTARTVVLRQTLPFGATFLSASGNGWACTQLLGVVTCTRPSLGLTGGQVVVTVTAPGGTPLVPSIYSSATVSASSSDPNPFDDFADQGTLVVPETSANLTITNTDGLGTATPGSPLTYTITVTNAGPLAATAAHVVDSLPAGLVAASWTCSATSGSACTPTGSGSINDTVNLQVGGTLTYTLTGTVRADAFGTLTNSATATVPAGLSDPNAADNTASDTDNLTPSTDLAASAVDTPDPAPVFGTITYALGATNIGPSEANSVTTTLTLPAGLTFATASAGCTNTAGTVTCNAGTLSPSQSRAFSVSATANPGTRGVISATLAVSGTETDPASANNSLSVTTNVRFAKGDLENDLNTDLVLRKSTTGENAVWLMNGITRKSNVLVTPDPTSIDQQIVGIDDFSADNRNDLVFWNQASGDVEFWMMGGPTGSDRQGAPVPLGGGALAPPWKPSATADFNHDGRPDLVWRNFSTQKIEIWTLNGTSRLGDIVPSPDQAVDQNWEIVGAQDWNADGNTDFLWYNPSSGKIVLWFMDANVVRITGQFTNPANAGDNNWRVLAMGDYGVGPGGLPNTVDIVWRNASSGRYVVWYMDVAGNRTAGVFTSPDSPTDALNWTIVGPR